ncbi:hypothetical protein [Halarsenatibacter silvermanii]|nr:hypothetical protein [Halarsenatibacter silvermanii]
MKIFELLLLLTLILLVSSSFLSPDFYLVENMILRNRIRSDLLQVVHYARSEAYLSGTGIEVVLEKSTDEIQREERPAVKVYPRKIDSSHSHADRQVSISGEVKFPGFSDDDWLVPFQFAASGNSRSGTLEWEVGESVEKIVVNNRGRIRLE